MRRARRERLRPLGPLLAFRLRVSRPSAPRTHRKRRPRPWLAAACLLAWLAAVPAAAEVVQVGPGTQYRDLDHELAYRVDRDGDLGLLGARTLARGGGFTEYRGNGALSFGFNRGATYWLHLRLRFEQGPGESRYLITVPYAPLDEVTLFWRGPAGDFVRQRAGDGVPVGERPLATRYPVFPLDLDRAGEYELYLRVRTTSSVQVPVSLWRDSAFAVASGRSGLAFGVYYGVMLAMILYNGLICFSIRDRLYLYYVAAAASTVAFLFCLNGFASLYLWTGTPAWSDRVLTTTLALGVLVTTHFSRVFLRFDHHLPRIDQVLRGAVLAMLGTVVVAAFAPYGLGVRLGAALVVIASPIVLVAGAVCWYRRVGQAGYFVLAWLAFLAGAVTHSLKAFGVIPATGAAHYSLQIGSALEFVLLAFALADRLRTLKEENARVQRRANEELERRVNERTSELNEALEQLRDANQMLEENAQLDDLTGIHNRQYFDERFETEWRRARREGVALAVAMIDVDHFKRINDEHGHLVGDAVLPALASTLQQALARPGDVLARYGGEEFVALLAGVDRAGAAGVAERMRAAVEDSVVDCGGKRVSATVSIGYFVFVPRGRADERPAAMARADAALYAAKAGGRNRAVDSAELEAPADDDTATRPVE